MGNKMKDLHSADIDGDSKVSTREERVALKFKHKELEDADSMRDAQRKMAWFALAGMILYPVFVVISVYFGMNAAGKILGDMAATYFVSVAAIVAAFFGSQAISIKNK
jgi:hypothetical protein